MPRSGCAPTAQGGWSGDRLAGRRRFAGIPPPPSLLPTGGRALRYRGEGGGPAVPASARDYCFWWRRAGAARSRWRRRRLCAGCPGSGAAAAVGGRGGTAAGKGTGRDRDRSSRATHPTPGLPPSPPPAACATSPKSRPWVRGRSGACRGRASPPAAPAPGGGARTAGPRRRSALRERRLEACRMDFKMGDNGMIWGPSRSRSQARSGRRIYPSEVRAEIPPAVARLPGEVCREDGLSPAAPLMAFSGRGCRGAWVICAGVAAVRAYVAVNARVKCRAPEVLHPSGEMQGSYSPSLIQSPTNLFFERLVRLRFIYRC